LGPFLLINDFHFLTSRIRPVIIVIGPRHIPLIVDHKIKTLF
jgi:hypothetical protein